MRHRSVIFNIMRDVPRQDTQPENHSHLLLCMFRPFLSVKDLRLSSDESWAAALRRVDHESTWDLQTKPFRLHITGMLRQRLAADEESAKRRADASAARASQTNSTEGEHSQGDMISSEYVNDSIGTENVLLISRIAHAVIGFVNDVLGWCLAAGFSKSNTSPPITPSLTSGRTLGCVLAHLRQGLTCAGGERLNSEQKKHIQQQQDVVTSAFSTVNATDDYVPASGGQFNQDHVEPYLLDLRNYSHCGLSDDKIQAINSRRTATNATVATTDIGQTAHLQHPAVQRIAEEFGLNGKQREAFYLFASNWLSRSDTSLSDALRLYSVFCVSAAF